MTKEKANKGRIRERERARGEREKARNARNLSIVHWGVSGVEHEDSPDRVQSVPEGLEAKKCLE